MGLNGRIAMNVLNFEESADVDEMVEKSRRDAASSAPSIMEVADATASLRIGIWYSSTGQPSYPSMSNSPKPSEFFAPRPV